MGLGGLGGVWGGRIAGASGGAATAALGEEACNIDEDDDDDVTYLATAWMATFFAVAVAARTNSWSELGCPEELPRLEADLGGMEQGDV